MGSLHIQTQPVVNQHTSAVVEILALQTKLITMPAKRKKETQLAKQPVQHGLIHPGMVSSNLRHSPHIQMPLDAQMNGNATELLDCQVMITRNLSVEPHRRQYAKAGTAGASALATSIRRWKPHPLES